VGNHGLVRLHIDIGIDAAHSDLDGGKVIAWRDWVNSRTNPYDDHGHGTHVAGIVAGTGEGNAAYRGVAPGAALIGLKVLGSNGSGSLSNVTAAVDWAVANKDLYNIRVISMSLGTDGSSDGSDTLSQAVNRAADQGIIPVIAAGNAGPRRYTLGSPGAAAKAVTIAFAWARKVVFMPRRSTYLGLRTRENPVSAVNAMGRALAREGSCLRPIVGGSALA